MKNAVMLLLKALAGGGFVVLFSLVGESTKPKTFAGLFSAAPSIAIAGLLVTTASKSTARAIPDTEGMILGSIAMVVCCLAGVVAIRRWDARRGSLALIAVWSVVAAALYATVFR